MGLKTQNYEVKNMGVKLPQAYAALRDIRINGEYGTATFVVQTDRNAVFTKTPIETVDVHFKVNRNESPYKTAYNKAKEIHTSIVPDPITGEDRVLESKMPFGGWEDDFFDEVSNEKDG